MWILGLVLGICLCFVLLLCVPLELKVRLDREDHFRASARLEWMFGLIAKDLRRRKAKAGEKRRREKRRIPKIGTVLAALRSRGFVPNAFKFVRDIIRLVRMRELRFDLEVGLADPADTGLLFGLFCPATLLANRFSRAEVHVSPSFEGPVLRGSLAARFRVFPIQVIGRSIVFFLAPSTLRAIKSMIGARRK